MMDGARKSIYQIPEYKQYVKYVMYARYAQYTIFNLHVANQGTHIMSSPPCLTITINDDACMLRMVRPSREEAIPALMM
jgi:hypothetical protein